MLRALIIAACLLLAGSASAQQTRCAAALSWANRPATIKNLAALKNVMSPSVAQLSQAASVASYVSTVETLLCSAQVHGWSANMDALYIFAAPSVALAEENLVSTPAGIAQGTNYTATGFVVGGNLSF
jgi:hypothetical protein